MVIISYFIHEVCCSIVYCIGFAAIFAIVTPMNVAVAQPSNVMPDGEYKDGDHEGKSCPSKEKKTASVDVSLNI